MCIFPCKFSKQTLEAVLKSSSKCEKIIFNNSYLNSSDSDKLDFSDIEYHAS